MRSTTHNGFEITARSQWDADSGKWSVEVVIMRETDGMSTAMSKQFKASEDRNTEDEAVEASLGFGKRIVDGQEAGCDISDL